MTTNRISLKLSSKESNLLLWYARTIGTTRTQLFQQVISQRIENNRKAIDSAISEAKA